ncbi:MAG: helix-turn-helix domain-containing protein [Rhodospirillaceae bacterium]
MTPFGAHIRQLRADRGMTLSQMAAELNLSAAYLSALEHGKRGRPAPGLVMQICGLFGLIWDEAETLKHLASLSVPKVTLDLAGRSPLATETVNLLAARLDALSEEEWAALKALLDPDLDGKSG